MIANSIQKGRRVRPRPPRARECGGGGGLLLLPMAARRQVLEAGAPPDEPLELEARRRVAGNE